MSLRSVLLKEGSRHLAGVEEAVLKNLEAVKDVSTIVRTSLGPQGLKKMVINPHEKLFVTNDSSTILSELDVFHPVAKIVIGNSSRQNSEVGDGTNFVVSFTGELLGLAESLLRMGLHVNDIIRGYEKASEKAIEILKGLSCDKITDFKSVEQVRKFIRTSIMAKQYNYEEVISKCVAEACISICPTNPIHFDVDNVRTVKIPGGATSDLMAIKGMIIDRDSEGTVKRVENAKVAVYGAGLDASKPESKDTFLITLPEQLEKYQKAEEDHMESVIREISNMGINVVACHGKIGDLAMHFLEKYKIFAVKLVSKFDVGRLCKAVGAQPLFRVGPPTAEEIGDCDSVYVEEVGSTKVTFFLQTKNRSRISTILLRGATDNALDDVERAVEKGIFTFKDAVKNPEFVPGAGSTEIDIAIKLGKLGESIPGLEQYAFKKFAEAFEFIPRTLAENAGLDTTQIISNLYAAHSTGSTSTGIDIEAGDVADVVPLGILDHLYTKQRAIELATDASISVLKIDQILMSKPAGGPKVPKMGPVDGGPTF